MGVLDADAGYGDGAAKGFDEQNGFQEPRAEVAIVRPGIVRFGVSGTGGKLRHVGGLADADFSPGPFLGVGPVGLGWRVARLAGHGHDAGGVGCGHPAAIEHQQQGDRQQTPHFWHYPAPFDRK